MNLSFFNEFYSKSPVTFFLAVIVLLVSLLSFINKKILFAFMLHPLSVVRQRQYYRIFTADLVNADFMHLALNEFMLYVFCSDLEETLRNGGNAGSIEFVLIYWGCLIIASALVIIRHYKDFNYSTTGTSGSIMGCMFAFMVIDPDYVLTHFPGIGEVKNVYGGLFYIIALVVYQRRKREERVNHEFHFYGAEAGLLIGLLIHFTA
jgi:membrane associated rhomboid family serine protease